MRSLINDFELQLSQRNYNPSSNRELGRRLRTLEEEKLQWDMERSRLLAEVAEGENSKIDLKNSNKSDAISKQGEKIRNLERKIRNLEDENDQLVQRL